MSLRTLRDTLSALIGSPVGGEHNPLPMDAESVWPQGDQIWSDPGSSGWTAWVPGSRLLFGRAAGHHHHVGTDWKNLFFWLAIFAVLVLFAVITNPTESSFRTHLTELSFRRHLADIRRSETDDPAPALSDEQASLPSTSATPAQSTPDRRVSTPGTETPTHTVAPFRFANHVAISLRTPTLLYRSLIVCSITITSPISPPAFLSDPAPSHLLKGKHAPAVRERHVIWFGCMGHWSLVGLVPQGVEWAWKVMTRAEREKGRKKNSAMDKAGVIEMRAVQNKEDQTPGAGKALNHPLAGSKNMRRTDSTSNLHDILALHAPSAPSSASSLGPAESRRPSIANLIAAPPTTVAADAPEIVNSPVITALKADLAAAQSVLTELQGQLQLHDQAVQDAHSHLQKNLDELRNRRKEDDAERQDLKSRTKNLEEQKRQAEAARREAEKKLKAVEGLRDGLEAKISAAESDIRDLRGNMENSEKGVRVMQEEGARFIIETQESIENRTKEVEELEGEIMEIEGRAEEVLGMIQQAEERLKAIVNAGEEARKIGPEEEMMMMAAAYEVAAQEGYQHGGYQHGHGGGRQDQWASQAAAYMAEAGMPHLGYEYTARPAHSTSTGFGHLSKHPNSASSRDLADLRRTTDVTGFEDFGPGGAESRNRTTTPPYPPSDSESDIYGHDFGSPDGGISNSFSANLLPQGLFRSLEGDQTPLVSGDEDLPNSYEEPVSFTLDEQASADHADDSASDSGDEDMWRSPASADPRLNMVKDPSKRLSGGGYYGRLLGLGNAHGYGTTNAPGHANANTTPPAIPGLPALPTSHRWFSGTVSSDNIPSTFGGFMHPTTSNDSLNLGPGYESSPFAPTSSEKKALAAKWAPFSKRWGMGSNDVNANGAAVSGWPDSHKSASSSALPESSGDEADRGEKRSFRFFSLRKPPSVTGSGTTPP
ncbi:hypothetical protein IAU60_004735 [Kwoniella sp. DSM 27419]